MKPDELRQLFEAEVARHVPALMAARSTPAPALRALHALRGAASMIGAVSLAAKIGALESALRANTPEDDRAIADALATALETESFDGSVARAAIVPPGPSSVEPEGSPSLAPGSPSLAPVSPRKSDAPDRRSDRPSHPTSDRPSRESGAVRIGDVHERPSLDPDVLSFFFSESRIRVEQFASVLLRMTLHDDRDALDEAFRHAHALKGSASTVGLPSIARAAHALEGALSSMRARGSGPSRSELDALTTAHAHLATALASPDRAPDEADAIVALLRARSMLVESTLPISVDRPRSMPDVDVVRVPTAAIMALTESVGDVGSLSEHVGAFGTSINEVARGLVQAAQWTENALRRIGPARPWGAPADALEKLALVQRTLTEAATALEQQSEHAALDAESLATLAGGARTSLQRLSVTTIKWLFDRVVPAAEALSRTEGKDLRVLRAGEEIELGRAMAERLVEPLSQLSRNAVTHGIEAPARRLSRAKPARGTLRLSASMHGDRLRIEVEDDGGGIDFTAASARAVSLGLLDASEAHDPSAVLAALFSPGVSTRQSADVAAGRGVGLDLVHREVVQLGGTVSVTSKRGAKTRFEIEIPVRPLTQRLLVLRSGTVRFAIPIERVLRVCSPAEARDLETEPLADWLGQPAPIDGLVVVLRVGAIARALLVDEVECAREYVVRPLPAVLSGVGPWSSAVFDAGSHAVLVLEPERL